MTIRNWWWVRGCQKLHYITYGSTLTKKYVVKLIFICFEQYKGSAKQSKLKIISFLLNCLKQPNVKFKVFSSGIRTFSILFTNLWNKLFMFKKGRFFQLIQFFVFKSLPKLLRFHQKVFDLSTQNCSTIYRLFTFSSQIHNIFYFRNYKFDVEEFMRLISILEDRVREDNRFKDSRDKSKNKKDKVKTDKRDENEKPRFYEEL